MIKRFVSVSLLGLVATSASLAQGGQSALLVLSKTDHTLAIVDPVTLKLIARMPVGEDPHEVVASSDGTIAYVSNYGFGRLHTLTPVDLVGHKENKQIDLGPLSGPHGLQFLDGKVWFTAEGAKAIGSYDPASEKVDWVMGTGQNRTHMLHVSSDQKLIVTTNVSSGTVTILEKTNGPAGGFPPGPPAGHRPPGMNAGARRGPPPMPPGGDWNETVIKVGQGAEGFDVSPDGKEAWVANAQDGTVSIIDLAGKRLSQTLKAGVRGANRLKFTPDGVHVLISGMPEVAVFDAASRRELKRIPVGHGGGGIQMQPDGARAFVACGPDNYVAVIDLKTLKMVAKIDAGGGPDGLAWAVR